MQKLMRHWQKPASRTSSPTQGTETQRGPWNSPFVLAIGGSVLLTAIRGEGKAHSIFNSLAQRNFLTSWGENSFTWDIGSEAIAYSANNFDVPYQMFALLSME